MEKIRTIAILPAGGAFGMAIGIALSENGHEVVFGFRDQQRTEKFLQTYQAEKLPGVLFPEKLKATNNLVDLVESADLVVMATKARYLREYSRKFLPHVRKDALFLCLTKGLEEGSNMLPYQVISDLDPSIKPRLAVLSGPNFAIDIARRLPSATVIASENPETAEIIALAFRFSALRAYPWLDPIGAGAGGALKNVIAVAAGMSDGLEQGESGRAAIVTRGKKDIIRLGGALGGREETFEGLSGEGDLWLSCTSAKSRNYQLGEALARGVSLEALLSSGTTYEGYDTAKVAAKFAREKGIYAPITELVYQVLHKGLAITEAKRLLLARDFVYEDSRPLVFAV